MHDYSTVRGGQGLGQYQTVVYFYSLYKSGQCIYPLILTRLQEVVIGVDNLEPPLCNNEAFLKQYERLFNPLKCRTINV